MFNNMWVQKKIAAVSQTTAIYVGFYEGVVYKSINNGSTWSSIGINSGTAEAMSIFANGSLILFLPQYSPLKYSSNNGSSWADSFAENSSFGRCFYAGTTYYFASDGNASGLYTSSTGTGSWTKNTNLGTKNCRDVVVDGDFIMVASDSGVHYSSNAGSNWTNKTTTAGLGSNNVRRVIKAGSTWVAATPSGCSFSTDGGANWTNRTKTQGLPNVSIQSLTYNSVTGRIFAICDASGIAYTDNGGAAWSVYNPDMQTWGSYYLSDIFYFNEKIYVANRNYDSATHTVGITNNALDSWVYVDASVFSQTSAGCIYCQFE